MKPSYKTSLSFATTLAFCLTYAATVSAVYAQQTFTQTVTLLSTNCNAACSLLDVNALTNNTASIIFITQSGGPPNPHPIGAKYMYLNRWSIFNLDEAAIAIGAKFTVEYANPDASHFVYIVPQRVSAKDIPYIDHAGLNGNPGAHVRVIARVTPTIGNHWNKDSVKLEYDAAASKWFIANTNGTPVPSDSAYNIVLSDEPFITNSNVNNTINTNPQTPIPTGCGCVIPTSLPPKGAAVGDLGGSYPNPTVIGLQGRPLSTEQPKLGQILTWSVTGWGPAYESAAPPTAPKPSALYFNQTGEAKLETANVDSAVIAGLNGRNFTLTQNSRVVFSTAIRARNQGTGNLLDENPVHAWVVVDILNASNNLVGRATTETTLVKFSFQNMNSVGIGILPAGTYHTRVTINRYNGGSRVDTFPASNDFQGGQMIIEIFPD